jgi:membrane-bound lytic murein transglycosylase D
MKFNFSAKQVFTFICCFALLSFSIESYGFKKKPKLGLEPDSTALDSLTDELKNYIPTLHAEIIKDRLACIQSRIKMTYSKDVQNWIAVYTVKQREQTKVLIERSSFYFPIFEEALQRHDMPQELKYLAIVESALTPRAASWAAAVGLWQFIPATGKEYGLHQDWFIDERMDIYKSTDAACRYLKFLYNYHGDWHLALAAYNCGPGRVDWAVKQAGGKNADFWSIYNYLPRETRGYVPAFIAVNYAMKYHQEHFIFPEKMHEPIPSDTVLVSQFLNIEEFAKQIDVPKEHLEKLNPHLKKNAIPAYKKNYPLRVPAHKKEYINANRLAILNASNRASRREMTFISGKDAEISTTEGKTKIYHTVAFGQSLALIGLKYGVNTASLRVWNRLPNDMIYPNQKLEVWVKPSQAPANQTLTLNQSVLANNTATPQNTQVANPKTATKNALLNPPASQASKPLVNQANTKNNTPQTVAKNTTAKTQIHVIKNGDTLWDIAKKYRGVTVEQIKKLNNINDRTMLHPGRKIVISSN